MQLKPFGLYVHIPFCAKKCPYCDFNTYAQGEIPSERYVEAILSELRVYASQPDWNGRYIDTIFFGGGTPSILPISLISKILDGVRTEFKLSVNAEITLEANPNRMEPEYYEGLKSSGVNRVSFGAQTFSPDKLRELGRDHTADQVEKVVLTAQKAGLTNLSIDLIFGLPNQSVEEALSDIKIAANLPISHLSTYSLTVEPGTPFFQRQERGLLKIAPEEEVVEMMREIPRRLVSYGFQRYEISNYARKGQDGRVLVSHHNLACWNGADYLGLGAGAHSFHRKSKNSAQRWSNCAKPLDYINRSHNGSSVSWSEQLTEHDLAFECFFLGLRKMNGVNLTEFREIYGEESYLQYYPALSKLSEGGFMDEKALHGESRAIYTEQGILLSDSILQELAAV